MSQLWGDVLSALVQVAAVGGLPFLIYFGYQKRFRKRTFKQAAERAGLQPGDR
ncbi:MAG: hypothetical protein HYS04_19685, partial [Acidobacteria bacterium]|nr:hypothetical protein [Acidobacteriota bacterium]